MSTSSNGPQDEFFQSLLGDFLDESGQLLDRLNENLLTLDDWVRSLDEPESTFCDDGLINDMFRSAHSLKGLSAMLGLTEINHLTHKMENVFDAARKKQLHFSGDTVELVFQALDRLSALVGALREPTGEAIELEPVLDKIQQVLELAGANRGPSSQADAEQAFAAALEAVGDTAHDVAAPPPAAEAPEDVVAPAAESSATDAEEPAPATDSPPQAPAISDGEDLAPPVDPFADLRDEAEIADKYLAIFIDEAEVSLDELSETLLAMEGGSNRDAVEKLLIVAHRIKGSAASMGLNRAAKLAHLMEDLMQSLVLGGGELTAGLTDALLKCTDGLREYVAGLRKGKACSQHFPRLAAELLSAQRAARSPASLPPETPTTPASPSAAAPASGAPAAGMTPDMQRRLESLRLEVAKATSDEAATLVGFVTFQPRQPLVALKAQLVLEKLSHVGQVCFSDPPLGQIDKAEEIDSVAFGLVTDKPATEVRQQLRVGGVEQVVVEPMRPLPAITAPLAEKPPEASPPPPQPQPASRPAPAKETEVAGPAKGTGESGGKPNETLRVDIDRLDQLMNLAGQLVINRARFTRIADHLKDTVAHRQSSMAFDQALRFAQEMATSGADSRGDRNMQAELDSLRSLARRIQTALEPVRREVSAVAAIRTSLNDLGETVHQLDRITDAIQQSVMDTRMVPIGPLFNRFKRVIRDISRSNGRNIHLVINGEKTELDKRMIDELGDPLLHMVRNSADHGIELPEVRVAAGKSPDGTVILDAFHRGNNIVIRVSDDGKGLDADRILRKALDKGITTPAEAEKLTRHQIYQFIWEPGLSTAEKVTEVSGRGMGMDIVRSKIEELNGTIDLDSEPGQGTTITIKLPLTLAILPSLMVDVAGEVFALPMESVVEIVRAGQRDLTTVHGAWTARVRGRVISVVKLDDIFTWNELAAQTLSVDASETTLVIVGERGREVGLAVSGVLGEENIVIKSMAENYRNIQGIAGASILGDGRVSLILDTPALIDMASRRLTAGSIA